MNKSFRLFTFLLLITSCNTDILELDYDPNVPVPENLSASQGHFDDQVAISWVDNENLYYQLYRSDHADEKGEPITGWERIVLFYDEEVEAEQKYYYRVRASFDQEGLVYSDFSPAVEGYRRKGWDNSKVAKPTSVSATKGDYASIVKVKWKGEDGLYFKVYRSTSSTSKGTSISDWIERKSFNDYNVKPGVNYYYRVRASSSSHGTRKSDYSSYSKGWVEKPDAETPNNSNDFTNGSYKGTLTTETTNNRYTNRKFNAEIQDGNIRLFVKRTLFNSVYSPAVKYGDVGYIDSRAWKVKDKSQNSTTWELDRKGQSNASVWLSVSVAGSRVTQLLSIESGATMTLKKEGGRYEVVLNGDITSPYHTRLKMSFSF